jgi:2-dehydropantoate 2-reductase
METVDGDFSVSADACSMEEFDGTADVIFVCVKGYSIADTIPFIQRISGKNTVVIPILNVYGTGREMQKLLPGIPVMDGCIYIVSEIKKPGVIIMADRFFRVVYGMRKDTDDAMREKVLPILQTIEKDLTDAGISPLLSNCIEKDAFQKFSFVSPMAAVGAFYDVTMGEVQKEGPIREDFTGLVQELLELSRAMDVALPDDIVERNLRLMDGLHPSVTASMQRDFKVGKESEVDGLVYEVVRLGQKYHVPVPVYKKIADGLSRP